MEILPLRNIYYKIIKIIYLQIQIQTQTQSLIQKYGQLHSY